MNETVNQENTTTAEQQTERTFTQSEVNAIIADRLSRERSKYADYAALKEKAQQFDAAQKQVEEMNKANARRELLARVESATGCPAELLTGETEEDCTAQAQAIMNFAKPSGGYPTVRDAGEPLKKPSANFAAEAFSRDKKHTPKPYSTF